MSPALCRLTAVMPRRGRELPVTRAHVRSCLRCQARGARERMLRKGMASLGNEVVPAPPYLAASVMARLGEQGDRRARRRIGGLAARYGAAAGVGAAAATALIAGAVRRRSRTA